jgi:hypothetical protein
MEIPVDKLGLSVGYLVADLTGLSPDELFGMLGVEQEQHDGKYVYMSASLQIKVGGVNNYIRLEYVDGEFVTNIHELMKSIHDVAEKKIAIAQIGLLHMSAQTYLETIKKEKPSVFSKLEQLYEERGGDKKDLDGFKYCTDRSLLYLRESGPFIGILVF